MRPVRTGAVLPTQLWLGHDAASDQPTHPGSDGLESWRDDLAALAAIGVDTVRIGLDWSRLQPRATAPLSGRWIEWYREVLEHAHGLGLGTWACLAERALPGWFADEGGFGDDATTRRNWPRWVDLCAESFHDLVDAWVPLDDPAGHVERAVGEDPLRVPAATRTVATAQRDAALLLAGTATIVTGLRIPRPLAPGVEIDPEARARYWHRSQRVWEIAWATGRIEFPGRDADPVADLESGFDVVGIWLDLRHCRDAPEARSQVIALLERYGEMFERHPLALTLRPGVAAPDDAAMLIDGALEGCRHSREAGIDLTAVLYAPGIATPGAPDGLVDESGRDRPPAEVLRRWGDQDRLR